MAVDLMRVFLVEDSALIRSRIIDTLRSLGGFDVVGVADSEENAVDAIKRTHPDVVVVDIRLKDGNGIEVVRQVRRRIQDPRPTIYVLSNYAYPEYKEECKLAGADDFFDKSSEYDRFLSAMQSIA